MIDENDAVIYESLKFLPVVGARKYKITRYWGAVRFVEAWPEQNYIVRRESLERMLGDVEGDMNFYKFVLDVFNADDYLFSRIREINEDFGGLF